MKTLIKMRWLVFLSFLTSLITVSLFAQSNDTSVTCGSYLKIHSIILGEDRTLLIHLPDDYGKSDKRYPVLYKLDGEKGNFLQAFSAAFYLSDMTGMVPEHIIVGIENTDRNRDMGVDAGASNFFLFLQSELIPFINRKYRTNDFSILCGQSSSAIFTLFSFLKQPDLFDAYILASFGLYNESLPVLFENELNRNGDLKSVGNKYIYVANGKQDSYDPDGTITKRGDQFLESLKQTVTTTVFLKYKMYDEEGHVPYYTIYDGLKWIYHNKGKQ
jgi:predicted alpha/beta superfamily hydrolase